MIVRGWYGLCAVRLLLLVVVNAVAWRCLFVCCLCLFCFRCSWFVGCCALAVVWCLLALCVVCCLLWVGCLLSVVWCVVFVVAVCCCLLCAVVVCRGVLLVGSLFVCLLLLLWRVLLVVVIRCSLRVLRRVMPLFVNAACCCLFVVGCCWLFVVGCCRLLSLLLVVCNGKGSLLLFVCLFVVAWLLLLVLLLFVVPCYLLWCGVADCFIV